MATTFPAVTSNIWDASVDDNNGNGHEATTNVIGEITNGSPTSNAHSTDGHEATNDVTGETTYESPTDNANSTDIAGDITNASSNDNANSMDDHETTTDVIGKPTNIYGTLTTYFESLINSAGQTTYFAETSMHVITPTTSPRGTVFEDESFVTSGYRQSSQTTNESLTAAPLEEYTTISSKYLNKINIKI